MESDTSAIIPDSIHPKKKRNSSLVKCCSALQLQKINVKKPPRATPNVLSADQRIFESNQMWIIVSVFKLKCWAESENQIIHCSIVWAISKLTIDPGIVRPYLKSSSLPISVIDTHKVKDVGFFSLFFIFVLIWKYLLLVENEKECVKDECKGCVWCVCVCDVWVLKWKDDWINGS